ncbi:hypothetical protein KR018_008601 [Drosophila ironensis]|nr:hypothetical protein KR018_008601 [Drosophila ironensis]
MLSRPTHVLIAVLALFAVAKAVDFVQIGDKLYNFGTTRYNWFQAYEACRLMKTQLVSFETVEEWSLVSDYLLNTSNNGSFWTSGTDLAVVGEHVWFSTGKGGVGALDIWAPNEPNNANGVEHCDIITLSTRFRLNDLVCSSKRFAICELN